MRLWYIGLFVLLPVCASSQPTQLLANLSARTQQLDFLPDGLRRAIPIHIKLVSLPNGALARYNPRTDTFEISKKHYRQDTQNPHLASCLLPLFVHESVHARLHKDARSRGFYWPVTLQDEIWAHFYQLQTEKELKLSRALCATWWPELSAERTALTNKNFIQLEHAVYERYSQYSGADLPPPPLTAQHIARALENRRFTFYAHTYLIKNHRLSARRFWTLGGNWLTLTKNALQNLPQDPNHPLYVDLVNTYQKELAF